MNQISKKSKNKEQKLRRETNSKFIAHRRKSDGKEQPLAEHLQKVAGYASKNASKIGLANVGELLGLLHDLGKYCIEFQNYIKSATGMLNPDEDEYVDARGLKGKIDHSTAGAQLLWRELSKKGPEQRIAAKIIALCLVSHHSGLIDYLAPDGKPTFLNRMKKLPEKTHFEEVLSSCDPSIMIQIENILGNDLLKATILGSVKGVQAPKGRDGSIIRLFKVGQLIRILFSCLIDADRTDTSIFERPHTVKVRHNGKKTDWDVLISRLEGTLQCYKQAPNPKPIDSIRADISEQCRSAADQKRGIFTLQVPTGGGKTLASLRFALYHAKKHSLDRIIFVVPFTTIIDQNANEVRKILEPKPEPFSSIVLEHHSNLTPDEECWRSKILSENWDAPVIFTTSVQLLEAFFSKGTRSVRRMHQLAHSLIIFDEIQTLPIKCIHLFNNSLNFLVESCGSSAVLCTATMPLLNKVDPIKGACVFDEKCEIMPDVRQLFDNLKRVAVVDRRGVGLLSDEEIASYAFKELKKAGGCLVIVNTKKNAQSIYNACSSFVSKNVFHLSTDMCPAHRMTVLDKVRKRLSTKVPLICVSTQLIEAGVDVDFGSVIRTTAGLDSIAQAAGRCNRHGLRTTGRILIVNIQNEDLSSLPDIQKGKAIAERVLGEFEKDPLALGKDLLCPTAMAQYYQYYFYDRKNEMAFPIGADAPNGPGRDDTLLDLLSINAKTVNEYVRVQGAAPEDMNLNHSFAAAGKIFEAIDAPTRGVVVPYGKRGKEIITNLASAFEIEKQFTLLKHAQRYSVNLFPWRFKKLHDKGALLEAQPESGVYYLDAQYYDENFGVSDDPVNSLETLEV